jgi:hypothetical protein
VESEQAWAKRKQRNVDFDRLRITASIQYLQVAGVDRKGVVRVTLDDVVRPGGAAVRPAGDEQGEREDVIRVDPSLENDGHLLLDLGSAIHIGPIGEGAEVHETGLPLVGAPSIDEMLVNIWT